VRIRPNDPTVLPLWEYYNADAHDTCASLAPILKVPAKHLVAINAWRFTVVVDTMMLIFVLTYSRRLKIFLKNVQRSWIHRRT